MPGASAMRATSVASQPPAPCRADRRVATIAGVQGPAAGDDREIAARLAGGDQAALADAYDCYGGLVFGLARRVLRDEGLAEDVTQEVFVFVWEHPERFDPERGSLRSWL